MLIELAVRDLGVIAEARIPLGDGMTALTGETGAGKTMVVEALHLLAGGRADASRVRSGATEAAVEGLFAVGDTEWVLRRIVPATGRSRCYLNGELTTATHLEELAASLLEVHGQHAQQSLLSTRHQRDALDRFAEVDRSRLDSARRQLAGLRDELDGLGGDDRTRQRQMDLLAHQLAEIETVAPSEGEEDDLARREETLAGAVEFRLAAAESVELLVGDGGVVEALARATAALEDKAPFEDVHVRLRDLQEELSDCASEVRTLGEGIEPDEELLAEVRARRQALVELRRKYGETIPEVLAFADACGRELADLQGLDARRDELSARISSAEMELAEVAAEVGRRRRKAAPELSRRVAEILGDLALPNAVVVVSVEDTRDLPAAGEAVEIRLSTNRDTEPGPLAKVASGGELSRVMLALRLVLSGGPPTMVFDEVDAGVGGRAATSVGAALAHLGDAHQVLVVTHLAQVAASARHQVAVDKQHGRNTTETMLRPVQGDERVVEISRMLSGSPDSATAREHAQELLSSSGVAP